MASEDIKKTAKQWKLIHSIADGLISNLKAAVV